MPDLPQLQSDDRPRVRLFLAVALVAVSSDIATKEWAFATGRVSVPRAVVQGVFHITPVYNDGVIWGALQNRGNNVLFIVISAAAVPIIVRMFATFRERLALTALALGGVLGGTLGNLYDRIVQGAVRDHLDFTIRIPAFGVNYHWPVFNVADAFICAGAVLFALCVMFGRRRKEAAPGALAGSAPQA